MIKIEIIAVQPSAITVALYYPVPDKIYSTASRDPSRLPAGSGLNGHEAQALKEGKLVEVVKDISPEAKSQGELRSAIEYLWDNSKSEARSAYTSAYSYMNLPDIVGRTWDGDTWS